MTNLVLDASCLSVLFPKASEENLVKVRIFGQIVDYDEQHGVVTIRKGPGMPSPHVVSLEDEDSAPNEECTSIDIKSVVDTLKSGDLDPGCLVTIIGFYNGEDINVVECCSVNGTYISPRVMDTMQSISQVQKLP